MNVHKDELMSEIEDKLNEGSTEDILQNICELLRERVPHYDWVGIYLVDDENPEELVLGPFTGADTEHTRIDFGDGICGQVAEGKETMVVQDVTERNNYLACNIHVKSEIVVPIFVEGEFWGEIDIDSHQEAPFSEEDVELLERIARRVGEKIG